MKTAFCSIEILALVSFAKKAETVAVLQFILSTGEFYSAVVNTGGQRSEVLSSAHEGKST